MKILVTGMSGLIGTALKNSLQASHELTAFNRSQVDGVETIAADLADEDAVRGAIENQDVVVHLAAKAGENYSWDELLETNVEGTRHVFKAAVDAGISRVVFASSGATVAGWESEDPYKALVEGRYDDLPTEWHMISVDEPTRPRGVYGATKVWGEALASHFADTSATQFVNVRIGYVNAEDRPNSDRARSVWCSQRDVVAALELAAVADLNKSCATFYASSRNRYGYRELRHGEELFGYTPQDSADDQ